MINLNLLWEDAKNRLSATIQAISFEVWIQKLEPVCFVKNQLVLLTNSKNAKQTIDKNYLDKIIAAIKEINPVIENVIIITENQKEQYLTQQDFVMDDQFVVKETKKAQNIGPKFLPKYTFENFVVGKSNEFACAAAQAVASNPGTKNNPLFIYGGVGLGKTHIMHAIGNYIREHSPQLKILYTTAEKFTNELIESIKSSDRTSSNDFREKYRNVDVLMIDDIQFLSRTNAAQEAIFHTFNDLYQNDKHIIISSDRPPKEISPLEERLRTRFQWGLLADIQPPDLETRIAILEKKAAQENFYLTQEVATFIAENVTTNIRDMEGVLTKVIFYSTLSGVQVRTVAIAQEALKDYIQINKESIGANDIINKTCQYFNIAKAEVLGKSRKKEIVEARMIAIYLIRDILSLPLQSIGSLFGGRDHTTIINSRNKIEELLSSSARTKIQVNDIKDMLYNH
jgi:chromosomal replication initiator protein